MKIEAFANVRRIFECIGTDWARIGLPSSVEADELQHYKKVANIEGLTDAETSADDAEESKPVPDISEAAMSSLSDLKPEEVIVVRDTPYDTEAAGKIGFCTIGVLCGGLVTTAFGRLAASPSLKAPLSSCPTTKRRPWLLILPVN